MCFKSNHRTFHLNSFFSHFLVAGNTLLKQTTSIISPTKVQIDIFPMMVMEMLHLDSVLGNEYVSALMSLGETTICVSALKATLEKSKRGRD